MQFYSHVRQLGYYRFAKMVCKILSAKGLEVKILRTKELEPCSRFLGAPPPP